MWLIMTGWWYICQTQRSTALHIVQGVNWIKSTDTYGIFADSGQNEEHNILSHAFMSMTLQEFCGNIYFYLVQQKKACLSGLTS